MYKRQLTVLSIKGLQVLQHSTFASFRLISKQVNLPTQSSRQTFVYGQNLRFLSDHLKYSLTYFDSEKADQHYMADNKFVCDYAKRGTASCKKCKQKIDKTLLRIAKVVPNPFGDGEGEMKQWFHPACIFETFQRARATTKIIQSLDDIEGSGDLKPEDKDLINKLITDMSSKFSPAKKKAMQQAKLNFTQLKSPTKQEVKTEDMASPSGGASSSTADRSSSNGDDAVRDNSFRQYRCLCAEIAEENSYNSKTAIVGKFLKKGSSGNGFQGDTYLVLKLLLPGFVKRVYNINSKQLIKLFSRAFGTDEQDMLTHLEEGDVAETIKVYFEQSSILPPQKKSTLSIQQVDSMLEEMAQLTKEDEQQRQLTKIAKRCTANDLKMVVRLLKHDLRINAGAKHVLEGLDPDAYPAFQASRDLRAVVDRVLANREDAVANGKPGMSKKLSVKASLMTPVLPMLAEACKSVEYAMKKCPNGMYAEIKYDGERVQVHKKGDKFEYYSRSLKPVLPHKVSHFKEFIPKAFPHGNDIILDSEVLLIDTNTGKPLPFGTLGVHKKSAFKDAKVCLFVFDCIHFNGQSLMDKPIKERRDFLHKNMTEVPNRIMFSEMKHITKSSDLSDMIMRVIKDGLEGLVLKDLMSIYEPGKRHWLKVKKDYLAQGAMADTADLVVLGAYYGTGNKGGMMSVFLMGCYNPDKKKWCTVTKVGNGHDDKTLERLQKELDMVKISKDMARVPEWLDIKKGVVPDFVCADPKFSPVWEITGAEFSKAEVHTAQGISIRFPRVTKIRDDKNWTNHTDLPRLKELFKKSKECSDIPDMLGASSSGTPSKRKQKDVDSNGSNSNHTTPKKLKTEDTPSRSTHTTPERPSAKRKMENVDSTPTKKEKPICKYGADCYQTNPQHLDAFKHPAKDRSPEKSKALVDIFRGMRVYLPKSLGKYKELKRYIVAYDGDVVNDYEKNTATHVVLENGVEHDDLPGATPVTTDWIFACVKKRKLVPVPDKK